MSKEWKLGDPMINERDYWPDENYVAEDKEKEKMVLQLATLITDRYIKKFSRKINNKDPEYWALDHVLTKDEVRFLLSLKKTRVPYSLEDLAKMNNMTLADTEAMVKKLKSAGFDAIIKEETA